MDKLQSAIQNIRSGKKNEGLRQLLEIAKSEPKNEQAWLWLGMALPDPAKQADCLKRVLLINPDNLQAANMLQKLEEEGGAASPPQPPVQEPAETKAAEQPKAPEQAPEPEETPTPSTRPSWAAPPKDQEPKPELPTLSLSKTDREAADSKIQRALTLHMKGDTQKALKSFAQGLDINPSLQNETFTKSVASELTGLTSDQALKILMDPEEREELLNPPKEKKGKSPEKLTKSYEIPDPKKPKKPRSGLIQTWLSFFMMDEEFLSEEAEHANLEDTLLSALVFTIAAVFFFMINGFLQFRQFLTMFTQLLAQQGETLPPLDFNIGIVFFGMLIGTLIMTPLSFIIGGGLQFLGARVFGGSGDFKSHIYLLALIQVPVTIIGGVVSLLANIPGLGFIGGLIGLGISIFALIITVRAIKAIHDLPTGRAVASMILPPLILVFLGGCLLMIFGSALLSALMGMG
jgi:tetratricopeptide (TPR) repeat protein